MMGVNFSPLWANSARVVGVKVSAEEKAKNERSSPFASVEAGDVVISNLTNVLEVSKSSAIIMRSSSLLCVSLVINVLAFHGIYDPQLMTNL